jgi:hypothetical protein
MSLTRALLVLSLAAAPLLVAAAGSATSDSRLGVPSRADLFAAGLRAVPTMPGGAGVLPPVFRFAAGPGKVLTFTRVSGRLTWGTSSPSFGADGDPGQATDIKSLRGISGIAAPAGLFLAGVFLGPSFPTAPAPRRYRVLNPGNVPTVAPRLQQVFFVGDGRTASGVTQRVRVPAGATRLYLGFEDAFAFKGVPGYYDDNGGALSATFRIAPG